MRDTLSVAVMSGKGGVGKSNLALNLGYALSRGGFPLLLMDCDLGLANLDVLLGITPEGNLQDVLLRDAPVTDVIHPLSDRGRGVFDILPAASGVPELAEMDADMRDMLLRRLEPLWNSTIWYCWISARASTVRYNPSPPWLPCAWWS